MNLSNGVDIVKVSRIERILDKNRERFLKKIFREEEIEYIQERNYSPQTVSGLFAAKEAISKLLGTGIGKIGWRDMEIDHDKNGSPRVRLYGKALHLLSDLNIGNIKISISHENEYAIAFAIGEDCKDDISLNIPEQIKGKLPKRQKDSHKGTYGRVGIIAGSKGMTGASYLTTMAALRTGSGLVYTITPDSISDILSIKLIEAIVRPVEDRSTGHFVMESLEEINDIMKNMDVLAIGPGMGVGEERIQLVKDLLLTFKGPVVLDADGLNCISKIGLDILKDRIGDTVITPHPGEFSRLAGVGINHIQGNRIEYSKFVSNKYNVITVLKGSETIVSNFKGEVYVNSTGNSGMATAGSGDVLTGMITSFIGQGINSYEASIIGVYCHGLAGDLAKLDKGEYGIIARDILENIPRSINILSTSTY